jgi:hypothetical protein
MPLHMAFPSSFSSNRPEKGRRRAWRWMRAWDQRWGWSATRHGTRPPVGRHEHGSMGREAVPGGCAMGRHGRPGSRPDVFVAGGGSRLEASDGRLAAPLPPHAHPRYQGRQPPAHPWPGQCRLGDWPPPASPPRATASPSFTASTYASTTTHAATQTAGPGDAVSFADACVLRPCQFVSINSSCSLSTHFSLFLRREKLWGAGSQAAQGAGLWCYRSSHVWWNVPQVLRFSFFFCYSVFLSFCSS